MTISKTGTRQACLQKLIQEEKVVIGCSNLFGWEIPRSSIKELSSQRRIRTWSSFGPREHGRKKRRWNISERMRMQAYVSFILVVNYRRLQGHLQGGAVRFKAGQTSKRMPRRASEQVGMNGYAEVARKGLSYLVLRASNHSS
jgi:hypothetical protein